MSMRVILKGLWAIAALSMIMLLCGCGGSDGGGNPSAESNPGLYEDLTTPFVDLSTPEPIKNGMGFSYNDAEYDAENSNHWKITAYGGDMTFSIGGPKYFSCHTRSSSDISGTSINIYINGSVYEWGRAISTQWEWYNIPPSAFLLDSNTVRIKLMSSTELWLDVATTQADPVFE